MQEDKNRLFKDKSIADERNDELVLRGIQPKNQLAFKIFRYFRLFSIFAIVLAILGFGTTYIPNFEFITGRHYYRLGILALVGVSGAFIILMLLVKLLFLRKCPFDNWVFEKAQRELGTETIFYTSKCLYIGYDIAATKEVDKQDFVTSMSDLSNYYSYFYVNTFVDQQVIQVECTKKQPIPTMAKFTKEDDPLWNIIPLGLSINNITQKVAPLGWTLNTQEESFENIKTEASTSILITGGTGSGKSVAEHAIVGHVSRFPDRFQLAGVDMKRVEFNLLRGVRGVVGVALDPDTAAQLIGSFQQIMKQRFEFMEKSQVNNVYSIVNKQVDYYHMWGQDYQFDEIFEVETDLDPNDRKYSKLLLKYPDGRIPKFMTIESIYKELKDGTLARPKLHQVKGYNPWIQLSDITKTTGIFKPKAIIVLCDELNELMSSDDYNLVDSIKTNLGSIARLGRAAAVHLALAAQRASGGTINADLMNNIQMAMLLGGFDGSASQLMFEKDISNLAKPHIKGRGFIQAGKGSSIVEIQTYYTKPEYDWVFDENQKDTYTNPIFLEQKKLRKEEVDDSGWVTPTMPEEETIEEETADENIAGSEKDNDDDWAWEDEEDFEEKVPEEELKEEVQDERQKLLDEVRSLEDKEFKERTENNIKLNFKPKEKQVIKFKL